MFVEFETKTCFRIRIDEPDTITALAQIGARFFILHNHLHTKEKEHDIQKILINERSFCDHTMKIRLSQDLLSSHKEWWLVIELFSVCICKDTLIQVMRELNR